MISRNMVKSKASSVHPSHAATQANHCSLVGSFHHAKDEPERSAAVVMAFPPTASQGSQVRLLGNGPPTAMLAARCSAKISANPPRQLCREATSVACRQQRRSTAAELGY